MKWKSFQRFFDPARIRITGRREASGASSWKRGYSTRLPFAMEQLEGRILLSAAPGVPTELPLEVIAVEMSPVLTSKVGDDGDFPEFIGDRIFTTAEAPVVEIQFDSLFSITDQVSDLGNVLVDGIENTKLDNDVGYILKDLLDVAAIDLRSIFSLGDVINTFVQRNNPFPELPDSYPVDLRDLQVFLDQEWLADIPGPANILNLADTNTSYNLQFSSEFDLAFTVLLEPKLFSEELAPIELDMELRGEIAFQLLFDKETGLVDWKQDALFIEISWDQEYLGQYAYIQTLRERFTTDEVNRFFENIRRISGKFTPDYVEYLRRDPFARVPEAVLTRLLSFPQFADVSFVEGRDFEYPDLQETLTVELDDTPEPGGDDIIPPIFAYSTAYQAAGAGLPASTNGREPWWKALLEDDEEEEDKSIAGTKPGS